VHLPYELIWSGGRLFQTTILANGERAIVQEGALLHFLFSKSNVLPFKGTYRDPHWTIEPNVRGFSIGGLRIAPIDVSLDMQDT